MTTKAYDIEPTYFGGFAENAVRDWYAKNGGPTQRRGFMVYQIIKDAHANVLELTTNYDDKRFVVTRDIYNDEIRMVVGNETYTL